MASLSDIIGNAKLAASSRGSSALGTAANQLAQGNLSGAVSGLLNTPSEIINSIGATGGVPLGDDFRGINARSDAVQNWCWYCLMPDIVNSGAVNIGGFSLPGLGNIGGNQPAVSLPWYYVPTANMPWRDFNAESIKRNGHQVHYPEGYSVGSLSLGFYMDSSSKAQQYLKAWSGLIMGNDDPSIVANQGVWGMPAKFKKDIQVIILSVDRKELLIAKYLRCWPSNPTALNLTSGAAEAMVQEVQFMCEDMTVTVNSDKGLLDTLMSTAAGYAIGALSGTLSRFANNFGIIGG